MTFSSLLSIRSHPVRVRGLKQQHIINIGVEIGSHPVRVRGLKHGVKQPKNGDKFVAPRAGAWIETPPTNYG